MKKIIKKTFSLALAVCMLCSLNVFASADESASLSVTTSEAILVQHNATTGALASYDVKANEANMNGQGVSANAYILKTTSNTTDARRLYLEFDVSAFKNWDMDSATLTMNLKQSNSNASSLKIYDASSISGDLVDIPTNYAGKATELNGIATDANFITSINTRGATSDNANGIGIKYGRSVDFDLKEHIETAIASGEDSVTLMLEFYNSSDVYQIMIAAAETAYAPTLSVTGTPRTTFSVSDVETVAGTNPVVYNYTNNVQVEVTEDMSILNNSANGYYRVFVTFDLTSIDKAEIEKATFKNAGYRSGGTQSLKITKVTTPFNPADNTYVLDETSAVESTAFGWQTWETVTADLTTMIKNCEGNSLTVCIENTSGSGGLRFTVTSDDHQNPAIDLVYASETATELATLAAGTTVTAERFVQIGSAAAPQSAVPIIALYEDGELSSIKIGEAISLDGTGQTVSASVTATETLSNPKATFFLWTSLQELVPLMESSSIE